MNQELKKDIYNMLKDCVSDFYVKEIADEIIPEIEQDVMECSGINDEGEYTEDDLKIAFGRVLINRLNLN